PERPEPGRRQMASTRQQAKRNAGIRRGFAQRVTLRPHGIARRWELKAKPRLEFNHASAKRPGRTSELWAFDRGTVAVEPERRQVQFVEYVEKVGAEIDTRSLTDAPDFR